MRNYRKYKDLPFNPHLLPLAKTLRQARNLSEVKLWMQLNKKKFKGFDFDRQVVIGNFIVDLYCNSCDVVIEIDGKSHNDKVEYDRIRDNFLKNLGLTVIHIKATDVLNNIDDVMKMLHHHPALQKEI